MSILQLTFSRLNRFSTLAGGFLLSVTSLFAQSIPADPEDFHLYLLMGQSNMVGDNISEPEDFETNPRILRQLSNGAWALAADPLHNVGTGPGMAFARKIIEELPENVVIGLIPVARGATDMTYWIPGATGFNIARSRAELALDVGRLKGILWHQGESDSATREQSNAWQGRLLEIIDALREEFQSGDVPFIAGELGYFLGSNPGYGFYTNINNGLQELPVQRANTAVVSAAGLPHLGDFLHFGAATNRAFGRRYFDAYRPLRARFAGVLPEGNEIDVNWFDTWLGIFQISNYPWIFSLEHGFIYALEERPATTWFFDPNSALSWWYTTEELYPYIYSLAQSSWLYYYRGTTEPRVFYNFTTQEFLSLDD
jgi:hypothetical protein